MNKTQPQNRPQKRRVNKKKNGIAPILIAVLLAIIVGVIAIGSILFVHSPDRVFKGEVDNTQINPEGELLPPGKVGFNDEVQFNFFILGRDRAAYNTDVMMLVNYNLSKNSVTVMQIPRDTYVNLGLSSNKANAILATYRNQAIRNKEENPEKIALEKFCDTMSDVLGVQIDYYAMMDLNGFVNIVDAIGGVRLTVPYDMDYDDPYQNLHIHLKAGEQTLNGDQAEQFVRFRKGYVTGDIGRVDAQKIFINACIKAVKNNFSVSTVSAIVEQTSKYLVTNIKLADAVYFAKKALSVDTEAITFMTIPGIQCRQYDTSGIWFYTVHEKAAIEMLNTYFNSYNYLLTTANFDKNHALYDAEGSYMYSIYKSEEDPTLYTGGDADTIRIPQASTHSASASAVEEEEAFAEDILPDMQEEYEEPTPELPEENAEQPVITEAVPIVDAPEQEKEED